MEYQRFAVQLRSADSGQLSVAVLESEVGEASTEIEVPLSAETLDELQQSFDSGYLASALPRDDRDAYQSLEKVGHQLFRCLFPPAVEAIWREARGRARDSGVRFEFHVDPRDERAWAIASWPWELLFDPQRDAFLGLDRSISFVRYLTVGRPAKGLSLESPLSVLVAQANPGGERALDLDGEWETGILPSGQLPGIEVRRLKAATPSELRSGLVSHRAQVLHFMGHGYSDPETGWGGLVLEGAEGGARKIGGPQLRDLLQGLPDLSLVVLNACRTATSGSGAEPFAGAAAGLVQAGLPAVVAMQHAISDPGAVSFCRAFYRSLGAGLGIDAAVVEARIAMRFDAVGSLEWVTPALFLRGGVVTEGQWTEGLESVREAPGAERSGAIQVNKIGRMRGDNFNVGSVGGDFHFKKGR